MTATLSDAAGDGTLTARFLAALAAVPVTAAARDVAALIVADALAVGCAARKEPGPGHLLALAEGGEGPCHILGHRRRLGPVAAARINGALIHVLDYEPMWNPANHAVSTSVPGLLALAALRPAEPERLLDALVRGIEAMARLRLASRQFEPGELVHHPPGVVGPIGSAVACGVYIGLSPERLRAAVGIAASRAGGVLANVGSMTKALHCGQAAASGLEAALLAERGFTAHPAVLDGARGFLNAYFGPKADPEPLTAASATPHLLQPGPAWKLYPAQYGTQFVIEAGLALARRMAGAGLAAAAIAEAEIVTPVMPYVDRPLPGDGHEGKFSMQYGLALALADGRVGLDSYTDARRFEPEMEALLRRIRLRADPSREGRFDRMRVEVSVVLGNGTRLVAECDGPEGIWSRPVRPERLAAKIADCLAVSHGPAAQELAAALLAFGRPSGPDLPSLLDRLEDRLP